MDLLASNLTGDLDFGENNSLGLQLTPDYQTEAEQRLFQALDINLTEWFADITKGIPYLFNKEENLTEKFRYILGDKNPDAPQFAKRVLDKYIESLPFIDSLTSSYVFDEASRVFKYTPFAIANGSKIEINTLSFKV
jgi:hypothetical protein